MEASTRDDAAFDDDENTLLMKSFGDVGSDIPERDRPSKPHVSRRRLVVCSCAAGLLLALSLGIWFTLWETKDTLETSSEVPSADAAFVVESTSRTRIYNWTVTKIDGAPVGVGKSIIVANGQSPGPTIEANNNDRIIVYVKNGLDEGTSIHWHGLYQNHTNYYDGTAGVTQCDIPPGETLVYNFTLDGWSGTTWWHGHTGVQHTDGLFGPIIIHNPSETVPEYDDEHVLTLSDVYNTRADDLASKYLNTNPMETVYEPVPDSATINGHGQFTLCHAFPDSTCTGGSYSNLTLAPNKIYRLRLINAGSLAPIRFSVDGHSLTVIEADGTPVVPIEVERLTLHVAQRYSVLLTTNQAPSNYWMRATIDQSMFAYENRHMHSETLGVLRYRKDDSMPGADSHPGASRDLVADELVPADVLAAPENVALTIPFTFSIQRTYQQNWRSFINGTSWELPSHGQATLVSAVARDASVGTKVWPGDQLIATVDDVRTVDFVINNLDDGDHPFHLHGYKPWIMGSGKGRYKHQALDTTNPMRRDTFYIPRFSWMVIRIVTDTPGYWAFHCHVAWHMAGGALFQLAVQPASMAQLSLPDDIMSHCESWLQ